MLSVLFLDHFNLMNVLVENKYISNTWKYK